MAEENDWLKDFEEEIPEKEEVKKVKEEMEEEEKEEEEPLEEMFKEEEEREIERKFKCSKCGKEFDSEKILNAHLSREHEKPKRPEEIKIERQKTIPSIYHPEVKQVFLLYGPKGHGKTLQSLAFPGTISALSFDRKTEIIKEIVYGGDDKITVYDAIEGLNLADDNSMTESADKVYDRLMDLFKEMGKKKPDWVLIDCLPEFVPIAEYRMRYRNDLKPFEGVKNLNVWKERNMYIQQVHNKAYECAEHGVIYTTDSRREELIFHGDVYEREEVPDIPKWMLRIIREADYIIKCLYDPADKIHKLMIETSKNDDFLKTGEILDVSNYQSFWEFVGGSE